MPLSKNLSWKCVRLAVVIPFLAACALAAQAQVVFSPPKNISNTSGEANSQEIAVDAKGNINTVWVDQSPSTLTVFFSRSSDFGVTFSAPLTISQSGSAGVSPTMSAGPEGNVYIAWIARLPGISFFSVFLSRSTDGGSTFSAPLTISNAGADARLGQMAVDASGSISIVWVDNGPGNYALFFSRSTDAGATFSTPLNLSNNPSTSALNPQIAVDSRGNVDVFWTDSGGSFFAPFSEVLFTHSADGGATFSTPFVLDSLSGNPNHPVGMAPLGAVRDTSGNVNLLWSRAVFNGDWFEDDVRFARSTDGGSTFLSPVQISAGSGGGRSAEMAIGQKGDVNVVFNTNPFFPILPQSGVTDTLSRSVDGGATFPSVWNSDSCGEATGAQLGIDANDRIDVVYGFFTAPKCATPTSGIVFTQSSDGSSFSSPQKIGGGIAPIMTVDANGNVYVVWRVFSATFTSNIFFSRSVALSSVTLNGASVAGGSSATGTVTLNGPAPTGGAVISLSSSDQSPASVPESVTIPEGATSATFSVTTTRQLCPASSTISASFSSVTQTANLAVMPFVTLPSQACAAINKHHR